MNTLMTNTQKPPGYWSRGFTLVEMMVALAVASTVMAVIYSVHGGLFRSYTTQNIAADVQQTVRAGVDYMAEDIMMAGFDPEGESDAALEEAGSTKIRVTIDRNMNGKIDDSDFERISYAYNAGRVNQILYEGTAGADSETYIDNVTNLTFIYRNADGEDLITKYSNDPILEANRPEIRTVEIAITVREPAGRGGMVNRAYTTQVGCRNLGL